MDALRKHELLVYLADELAGERGQEVPANLEDDGLWQLFRDYVNTRQPLPASELFYARQDELLRGLIDEQGISDIDAAIQSPDDARLLLWRGDITTLAIDAIVNAANSQMLGCWVPGHFCIDNAIHTFAGVQLRLECARLMDEQGHEEPTASAKVTDAYNLPCRRVIHTVGPIAGGNPTKQMREQLAQCYVSCLDAAALEGLHTIAFCCISTGVFGFPADEASRIAVDTVREWLDGHAGLQMRVVFNVFSAKNERLYGELLGIDV